MHIIPLTGTVFSNYDLSMFHSQYFMSFQMGQMVLLTILLFVRWSYHAIQQKPGQFLLAFRIILIISVLKFNFYVKSTKYIAASILLPRFPMRGLVRREVLRASFSKVKIATPPITHNKQLNSGIWRKMPRNCEPRGRVSNSSKCEYILRLVVVGGVGGVEHDTTVDR